MIEENNCCICCGVIIPEGRHVCPSCEHGDYISELKPTQKNKKQKSLIRIILERLWS